MAEVISNIVHMIISAALWLVGAAYEPAAEAEQADTARTQAALKADAVAADIHRAVLQELRRAEAEGRLTAEQAQLIAAEAARAAALSQRAE